MSDKVTTENTEGTEKRIAIAESLDGITYDEIYNLDKLSINKEAKDAGCVIIYGISDDILAFSGAIEEETGSFNGTTAFISNGDLLQPKTEECEECQYYLKEMAGAIRIDALWKHLGYSWFIKANTISSPFIVYKDGNPFCRGIVIGV